LEKISPACQVGSPDARVADSSFIKRRQLFVGMHDKTLSVVVTRISNEDHSTA
jgi:hypothetical protein